MNRRFIPSVTEWPGEAKPEELSTPFSLNNFISNAWQSRMLLSLQAPEHWDAEMPDKKQEWGNLIHLILSKIKSNQDVAQVLEKFLTDGIIDPDEKNEIEDQLITFLNHPDVNPWFLQGLKIKTEAEILLKDGKTFRPDRLVFNDNKVTIIDFKTGKPEKKHREQVNRYLKQLEEMDYKNIQGLLLYFREPNPAEWVKI